MNLRGSRVAANFLRVVRILGKAAMIPVGPTRLVNLVGGRRYHPPFSGRHHLCGKKGEGPGNSERTGFFSVDRGAVSVCRVFHQEPHNQFAALNRGVELARGELLAFLDADDLWTPRSLEVRLARLAGDDEPEAVFGRAVQFVSEDVAGEDATQYQFQAGPARSELFFTMLIRRSAFDRVGWLDTTYLTSSNIDWISRSRIAGVRAVEIPDVVARRRIHGTNVSITRRTSKDRDLLRVVRAHRTRIRGEPA